MIVLVMCGTGGGGDGVVLELVVCGSGNGGGDGVVLELVVCGSGNGGGGFGVRSHWRQKLTNNEEKTSSVNYMRK